MTEEESRIRDPETQEFVNFCTPCFRESMSYLEEAQDQDIKKYLII
jgi:hypothetical protein